MNLAAGGRRFAAGAAIAVYAALAHYVTAFPDANVWMVGLSVAPMLLVGIGYARESRYGLLAWLALAAATLGLMVAWPNLDNPAAWLFFVQHVGVNGALAALFGRSLGPLRTPLCTAIAGMVRERMTPALLRYTRQVTLAWALFFLGVAVVSILLFFLAPVEVWSVFANLLTLPLVGAMFLAENEAGRRLLPAEDRIGIAAAIRAFRARAHS